MKLSRWDRFLISVAPKWGLERVRARATAQLMSRHFEAAAPGRRTSGWHRGGSDANAAASGASLANLRAQARDLIRNNPWARRGLRTIKRNTVGWGIRPSAAGRNAAKVMERWKLWAETTECDAAGRLTFYGLQGLIMRTVVESGEVLVRRRLRMPKDGLSVPMQLQVIEPDLLDTGKDGIRTASGGKIIQGIEFDAIGRRVAYWLYDEHPGSLNSLTAVSRRIPADGILHVFDQERAGQVRGPSWFASVDLRLHDFDEFEDATLMKQKIAALMAAFVTDLDGAGSALGSDGGTDARSGAGLDSMEPGMILSLPAGKTVEFANPPQANDHQSFSATTLRGVAAGLGVTYEDLTGDYSQVNYSSARMARIAHYADVHDWRWNMLIPQFCAPAWKWMLEALAMSGLEDVEVLPATWTPPPMQSIDPDKEAAASSKMVRSGQMTPDEMVREQGYEPADHWKAYADSFKRLDKLGIVLDCDPRKTSGSGQAQAAPAAPAKKPGESTDEEPAVAKKSGDDDSSGA